MLAETASCVPGRRSHIFPILDVVLKGVLAMVLVTVVVESGQKLTWLLQEKPIKVST